MSSPRIALAFPSNWEDRIVITDFIRNKDGSLTIFGGIQVSDGTGGTYHNNLVKVRLMPDTTAKKNWRNRQEAI